MAILCCFLGQEGSPSDSGRPFRQANQRLFEGEMSYYEMAKNYDFQKDMGARYAVKQCWQLSKQDYKYYILGVGFTILGA